MRLLLDTHTLLWAIKGALPKKVEEMVEDTSNQLYFSSVNLWEIQLKQAKLRLDVQELYQKLIYRGYSELQVAMSHVLGLEKLPSLHTDPFDRMLVSQARCEHLYLLTADKILKQYGEYLDCIVGFEI